MELVLNAKMVGNITQSLNAVFGKIHVMPIKYLVMVSVNVSLDMSETQMDSVHQLQDVQPTVP